MLLFSAADIFFTIVLAPYDRIFKRKYYMEIVHSLRLALCNSISVTVMLYIFNRGEDYSRTVFILTYAIYLVFPLS